MVNASKKNKNEEREWAKWTLRLLLLVKDARGGLHLLDKGIIYQRKLPMGLSA